jgi:L-alanine-DL-glutamate epimerase-like enolase superfamily enzyme
MMCVINENRARVRITDRENGSRIILAKIVGNDGRSLSEIMFKILDAEVAFCRQRLASPLRLSSGVIEELSQATVAITGEANGRRATGRATVYLSDLWAWPDAALSHKERDAALRQFCERLTAAIPKAFRNAPHHPLELGLRLHQLACHEITVNPSPPELARAMCASPFDAAIHDAAGHALGISAFEFYRGDTELPSADMYFPGVGARRAIADIIRQPRFELPAWYVVGIEETLESILIPAIKVHGYWCFKLKLSGSDNHTDVARTVELYRAAKATGLPQVRLTVDTNEANTSVESVLDYLDQLKTADPNTYAALEYLEQPTSRDIRNRPFDWRPVTKRKPVLLDEGLTDWEMLEEANRQGYSGLALKTCKGHSMLLACAAWAHRHGMVISLQDLTNPGISLIHAALVGAHLPTINGAELNSPQFTPDANREFAERLPELFEPRDGVHRLPSTIPAGLGSRL